MCLIEYLQVDNRNADMHRQSSSPPLGDSASLLLTNHRAQDIIKRCDCFFIASSLPDKDDPYHCGPVRLTPEPSVTKLVRLIAWYSCGYECLPEGHRSRGKGTS